MVMRGGGGAFPIWLVATLAVPSVAAAAAWEVAPPLPGAELSGGDVPAR